MAGPQILLWRQDRAAGDGLAHNLDVRHIRQFGRVVDVNGLLALFHDLIDNSGRRRDEIEVVLSLQSLLDDLHVQHTEEATAKAEAERIGCLGLVKQRRVVERQLAKGVTEILVIIGVDRKDAGINLRLYRFGSRAAPAYLAAEAAIRVSPTGAPLMSLIPATTKPTSPAIRHPVSVLLGVNTPIKSA